LSTALQNFYSAFSDVATNPTSTASRQALLGQAQNLASSFQNASGELNSLNTDVNNRISQDVTQINSIASSISTLNQQIVIGTAQGGNSPPNELLDQRDQLVSSLSQLVGVTTTTEANGSLNVFIGNGQPLVCRADHETDHAAESVQCLAAGSGHLGHQPVFERQHQPAAISADYWRRAVRSSTPH